MIQKSPDYELSASSQWLMGIVSFLLVAFGQPAWQPLFGILASIGGYALFWRVLLAHESMKSRFWLSCLWFGAVQLVQLSWFASHPFLYIYIVYFSLCFGLGIEFGLIGLFINAETLKKPKNLLAIAGLWTLLEWSRLFILSGFSWNPVGLALTGSIYGMQMASLWGVFGLSFWVILVNLLCLRAYIIRETRAKYITLGVWVVTACIPYIYGAGHLILQEHSQKNLAASPLKAMLVQTAFPIEELLDPSIKKNFSAYVISEWKQILQLAKKHQGNGADLIVLPEFVVPYGTFSFVYPLHEVIKIFINTLGAESLKFLPQLDTPFCSIQRTANGPELLVNNAFWAQGIANCFQADILVGLEDADMVAPHQVQYYSSAHFFSPQTAAQQDDYVIQRYEKRILVPMGEYIPFSFCQKLAAHYGICGSFTPGNGAAIMTCKGIPLSPSICYEETFADLIHEGRKKGAQLFVNLTSDVWYPNSRLPKQHFDHARLRSVENGIPLIRACNTGVTAAVDGLGRTIAVLGGNHPEKVEWVPDALLVDVPVHSYLTLYSLVGDKLIIGLSILFIFLSLPFHSFNRKLRK